MNKQSFEIAGVTEKEYLKWCQENKRSWYKKATKADFFARIQDGRLVRNKDGKLIRKYKM